MIAEMGCDRETSHGAGLTLLPVSGIDTLSTAP
jgi:hypothetical protein